MTELINYDKTLIRKARRMEVKILLSVGAGLRSAEDAIIVMLPDLSHHLLLKTRDRMTRQARNRIDSIAFTGLLLAFVSS